MNVRDFSAPDNSDNWARPIGLGSLYQEAARLELQGLQNALDHLLGITKQHHGVVPEEQFVVDARIT